MLSSLNLLISLLIIVIFGYAAATLPIKNILRCSLPVTSTFSKRSAFVLIVLFFSAYLLFIVKNEGNRGEGGSHDE